MISGSTPGAGGFPERLKVLRALRRMKQITLAMRLGVHVMTVSRWERGVARPSLQQELGLCEVLGISREELGLTVSPSGVSAVSSTSASSTGADQEEDVIRRELLQRACSLLGAAALSDWGRLASLLERQRVDGRLLDDLLTVTRSYARQWGEVAPTTLLPLVQRQAALLHALLVAPPESRALAQRLYSVSSETATVAGWLSVAVQNLGDARRHYGLARDLAREAGDSPRLAFALGASSSLFSRISSGDDPARALALLQEADTVAGDRAPAQMRSWLCARLAEEHAAQGEAAASDRELERARSWNGRAQRSPPPRRGVMASSSAAIPPGWPGSPGAAPSCWVAPLPPAASSRRRAQRG